MAEATFATHVAPKTSHGSARPLAARNAPNRTNVSAGTGGMKFSTAAPMPMTRWSRNGGICSRVWRTDSICTAGSAPPDVQYGDGQRRHTLAPADPPHSLVRLRLDGDALCLDLERGGQPGAHLGDERAEPRRLAHDGHIDVADAVSPLRQPATHLGQEL